MCDCGMSEEESIYEHSQLVDRHFSFTKLLLTHCQLIEALKFAIGN